MALRLIVLGGIWGSSFLFIEVALEGLTPVQVTSGRLLFGAIALAVAVGLGFGRYPATWRAWGQLAVLGLISNVLPFMLYAWGQQRVNSSLAGVLNATTPLFTAAISLVALRSERLNPVKAIGLLVGFAGAAVIVSPWDDAAGSLPGQLACLGAAALYGLTFVYTRRVVSGRIAPVTAATGQVTAAAAIAVVIALAARASGEPPPALGLGVTAAIVALGVFGTGVAYLLSFRLVELAGATAASMVTYVIPIVAVVLGVVVLNEPVTWNLVVGAAIVIMGIAVFQQGRVRATPEFHAVP